MSSEAIVSVNTPLRPARTLIQWLLGSTMVIVISLGWKYPLLGYMVPLTMGLGFAGSFTHGRYVCGNLCARGNFLDTFFWGFGGERQLPRLLFNPAFRWSLFTLLMAGMVWQISLNPGNPHHWGFVFWTMCTVTTAVALFVGTIFRARAWCLMCPMGTMAAAIGGNKYQLQISSKCEECNSCGESCPFSFCIPEHKEAGVLRERDCLKCSDCISACQKDALSWPS